MNCFLLRHLKHALIHVLNLRYHLGTMRLFFRFLLWLSITVLSFQGSAAMAIGQAAETAHTMAAATGHQDQQHQQHAEAHGGATHCGEHGSKTKLSSHDKCPACAACCAGSAAPPALPPAFHTPPLAASHHANPEAAMTSFVPSMLERPPRDSFV